jgi:predicted NBD/HSP70 family sugar kinase
LRGRPFFAVDVGGSSVKSARIAGGLVERVERERVANSLEGLVDQLARVVADSETTAWGLCIAGLVDAESGTVRHAANLPLRETPLLQLLAAVTPPPRVFVNDLVAATVGEAGGGTLALLQVGTGIAGRCAVTSPLPLRRLALPLRQQRLRRGIRRVGRDSRTLRARAAA